MITALLVLLVFAAAGHALDNGLARTPQMGWNSWNHFWCSPDEQLVREIAIAMVSSGLATHGYQYINIDCGWATTDRDSHGRQQFNATAWPSGPFAFTQYIHSLGLKAGIYSDAGAKTCDGLPGSLGYEVIDALSFAAWGFDYLKYDHCNAGSVPPPVAYRAMRDALNATGRPVLFSLCDGDNPPGDWSSIGNSWRTSHDIKPQWVAMISNVLSSDSQWQRAGPGGWNDPDMLEVGNGMTVDEDITHFSLWCLVKAPLILGNDIRSMTKQTFTILTNDELIAVNQDSLGVQGHRVTVVSDVLDTWAGPLADGNVAVVLVNRGNVTADLTVNWSDIGVAASVNASVRDLWQHQELGVFTGSFTAQSVRPHASVTLTVCPFTLVCRTAETPVPVELASTVTAS